MLEILYQRNIMRFSYFDEQIKMFIFPFPFIDFIKLAYFAFAVYFKQESNIHLKFKVINITELSQNLN